MRARLAATGNVGAGSSGSAADPPAEIAAEVALLVDDTEVGRAAVVVPAGGTAPVAFDPFTLTNPFTRGELRFSDNALQADNTLHFVASPGGDLNVLVVDPLGNGESNLYLRGALGIAEGAGFATRVVRGVPTDAALADQDVVVVNGGPFPGGDSGARLRDFVEDGGGLLVVLGERTRIPSVHAEFLPAAVGGTSDAVGEQRRLGFVDYDHAVFEAFQGARSGDFSRAAFFPPAGLSTPQTAACSRASTTVRRRWWRGGAAKDGSSSGPRAWTASGTTYRCTPSTCRSSTEWPATWAAGAIFRRGTRRATTVNLAELAGGYGLAGGSHRRRGDGAGRRLCFL